MRGMHVLRTTPAALRTIHTTSSLSRASLTKGGLDPAVSQSHATSPSNKAPQSVQSIAVAAGMSARHPGNDHHLDAASPHSQYKPRSFGRGGGNPEGVGFVEQIGGASVSADNFSNAKYMGTGTGTSRKRSLHASAVSLDGMYTEKTVTRGGQDPAVSQGHAASPDKNSSPQDMQSRHVAEGVKSKESGHPMDVDASHRQSQHNPGGMARGNREHIGFVDQVGGASASGSRYMPDDVNTKEMTSSHWEGASARPGTVSRPSLTSMLKHTVQSATTSSAPNQWEGYGNRAFSTTNTSFLKATTTASPSGRSSPHTAGRTQKQKDAHLGLGSGGPSEYESAKLAGSRFGETGGKKGSVTVGEEVQSRTPGVNANKDSPSGDFKNTGVPVGKPED